MAIHVGPPFYLVILCLAAGYALIRRGIFPPGAHRVLNLMVVHVALPAMVLIEIPVILQQKAWSTLWMPALMPWIFFGLSWVFFATIGHLRQWDRRTMGALVMTGGLCNTSFVGFPLLEAFYGPESLATGLIVDQAGSFLVLSSLGTMAAAYYAGHQEDPLRMMRRVIKFPPFLTLILACLLTLSGMQWSLKPYLGRLADLVIPLALLSVGTQLHWQWASIRRRLRTVALGLGWKLVLGPAVIFWIYWHGFGVQTQEVKITIAEAAMAPMITGAIVAMEQGLDSELASLMLGLGIPLSLVTVGGWVYFMNI